jgi:hypothetical protein
MKTAICTLGAAVCLCAGLAFAQPVNENPPTTTVLCLDVSGRSLPATCKVPGGRLDPREDICICPAGGERVTTPICPKGVRAPAESAAYERARRAAVSHGSLVGATFEGKPMCVAPRNAIAGGH